MKSSQKDRKSVSWKTSRPWIPARSCPMTQRRLRPNNVVAFTRWYQRAFLAGLLLFLYLLAARGVRPRLSFRTIISNFRAPSLMILFLSWLYSRQISRPLVQMNRVAEKIARYGLSEACTVQSRDELGNLSRTINFLSDNLSNPYSS
jgi:nitrate/nitrite-specific signal transduction histidine kinase